MLTRLLALLMLSSPAFALVNGHEPPAELRDHFIQFQMEVSARPENASTASLQTGRGLICSGTVISPRHIITAGHCVSGGELLAPYFTSGHSSTINLLVRNPAAVQTRRAVRAVYIHRSWPQAHYAAFSYDDLSAVMQDIRRYMISDIAVIELSADLSPTFALNPLPLIDQPLARRDDASLLGFGYRQLSDASNPSTPVPGSAQIASGTIHSFPQSATYARVQGENGSHMLPGDSGGALLAQDNGAWFLAGVLSYYGQDATRLSVPPDSFAVRLDTEAMRAWVEGVMGGDVAPSLR